MSNGLVVGRVVAPLNRLMRWRRFPEVLQGPVLALVAAVAFMAAKSPHHSEMNAGAAVIWLLWWVLLPFLTVVAARVWCSFCPFATLGDLAQRFLDSSQPLPPLLLRRVGPWIGAVLLVLLAAVFLLFSLESDGPLTAALLAAFAAAAIVTAILWRGRTWCRYLCPLGLLLGLYSRLAWLRLRPVGESGRRAAAAGARGCPLFTSTLAARSVHDCVFCSRCLRVPGSDSVVARLEVPSLAGQVLLPAESVAVPLLLGLLLVDAARMTPLYSVYMAGAMPVLGGRYELAMALGLAGVVVILLLAHVGLSLVGDDNGSFWSRFGYMSASLLPLAMAVQLAVSTQHMTAIGDVVRSLAVELEFVEPGHMPPADVYRFLWPLKLLQWSIVAVGVVVSFNIPHYAADRGWLAPKVVTALAGLLLLVVFAEPMSVAC